MPRPPRGCRPPLFLFLFSTFGILTLGNDLRAENIEVTAEAVSLVPAGGTMPDLGPLTFRGALALSSPDPRFGGLSALGVSADGSRMVALSDRGLRLLMTLQYDASGNLSGAERAELGPLTDPNGDYLNEKHVADAEAMAPGAQGEIIVAFERAHRIWAYPPNDTQARVMPPPDELARAPANGGIEALTLLETGALLAIAEDMSVGNDTLGWLSSREGWSVLTYALADGFKPTGAATLPTSGDVLVLERRYTLRDGVKARIRRINAEAVEPGARLEGDLLAELKPPALVDNMEGIEARLDDQGRTMVYLISDDNFSQTQRTLLMMFELRESKQ